MGVESKERNGKHKYKHNAQRTNGNWREGDKTRVRKWGLFFHLNCGVRRCPSTGHHIFQSKWRVSTKSKMRIELNNWKSQVQRKWLLGRNKYDDYFKSTIEKNFHHRTVASNNK